MSNCKKLLLLGAGGHCISVLDSVMETSEYDNIGIVDKSVSRTDTGNVSAYLQTFILGDDNELPRLFSEGYTHAFIAIGSTGNTAIRRKMYYMLKEIGFIIPNIIDKSAVVSKSVKLNDGIYIGKNAVVNALSVIGSGAIVNTSCTAEHECEIGDFVHISPGVTLCGNVCIDEDSHIGAGSVIKQGIHVGSNTMIGMGSVVLRDIGSGVTAYGSPCKEVKV